MVPMMLLLLSSLLLFLPSISAWTTTCTLPATNKSLPRRRIIIPTSTRSTSLTKKSTTAIAIRRAFTLYERSKDDDDDSLSTKGNEENETCCNNIVILGGGFGGLNTALTLDSLPWPKQSKPNIILVDNKERFVFLPLLYELCVGDADLEEVAPTFKSLLQKNSNIQFMQRNVQGIDIDNNKVYLTKTPSSVVTTSTSTSTSTSSDCINVPYNSLILATGSSIDLSSINGATKYALPFYTLNDCYQLRKELSLIDLYIQQLIINNQDQISNNNNNNKSNSISIVIVGGGYSGVELALNLKQRLTSNDYMSSSTSLDIHITILHRGQEVLQYANEYNRNNGQSRLRNAGIHICTNQTVLEVLPPKEQPFTTEEAALSHRCQIVTNESTFDADLLLWTAGAMSKNEQRDILNSKLPRDVNGRIVTNEFLRVKGLNNVYALGDCSRPRKLPYPATAAVAMQQAPVVAWNVFSSTMTRKQQDVGSEIGITSYEQLPFEYLDLGQMMTLGDDDATITSLNGLFQLDGSIASFTRRLIYAIRMPTLQQALIAAVSSTNKRLQKSSSNKVQKIIDWK